MVVAAFLQARVLRWRRWVHPCLLVLLAGCAAGPVQVVGGDDRRLPMAPMHEAVLRLPGDPTYPITLEVTLFEPPGAGPFPLAVMNHGATNASAANRGERYRFATAAYYFLSRGYAVALPMMRGFAGSGGNFIHAGCDYATTARRSGRDIAGVIEALGRRPEIDGSRVVVAGQSFGAWNTLGLGVEPPAGVRGLVAFNPAIRSSDCPTQDRGMETAAATMGAKTRLPSLWFYGENDTVMPSATWRAVYQSYNQAGGHGELVDFGTFRTDSHQLLSFPESMKLWTDKVDAFLGRIGLPSAVVDPDYLPHPPPPATHWAEVGDVLAVPYIGEPGRALYRKYLTEPDPRAFVIASNGSVSQASGGYDPLGFALRSCARFSASCGPYAVDGEVVWSGPRAGAVVRRP